MAYSLLNGIEDKIEFFTSNNCNGLAYALRELLNEACVRADFSELSTDHIKEAASTLISRNAVNAKDRSLEGRLQTVEKKIKQELWKRYLV